MDYQTQISLLEAVNQVAGDLLPKHIPLPSTVIISDRLYKGDYGDQVIAGMQQRDADHDQLIFKADDYDFEEFGGSLGSNDVLVRVQTPMSSPDNTLNRTIAKINLKRASIAFVDNDKYENENIISWEKPRNMRFLTIDRDDLDYFKLI